jgi:hypothetical protein
MNGLFEHHHCKSQEMQANQGFWQTFHNPSFWQQYKAFLGF